jgi:hypothetical protein
MWQALLLKTSGEYEVVKIPRACEASVEALQKCVGGHYELLPGKWEDDQTSVVWLDDEGKRWPLCGYANEAGLLEHQKLNPWSALLDLLGFAVSWSFGGLCGDLVLMGEDCDEGDQCSVPDCVVKLFEDAKQCDDEDDYLTRLEEIVSRRKGRSTKKVSRTKKTKKRSTRPVLTKPRPRATKKPVKATESKKRVLTPLELAPLPIKKRKIVDVTSDETAVIVK